MNNMVPGYASVIDDICDRNYKDATHDQMTRVAWAYYYFSVQFREHLQAALGLYPDDAQLQMLVREECNTDNLSPWPGVAAPGEKLDHDTFMARVLRLSPLDEATRVRISAAGEHYLRTMRAVDAPTKAMSIASYEDGGLERVFGAFLQSSSWETPLLAGFQHFLRQHILFDSNPDGGHGSLCRHLAPDERIRPLWVAFRDLLDEAMADKAAVKA
jgi:hypothetical protein